ncbi:hypothetical protein G9A89_000444 [Geosiphon pyriformis]|nr:hypothetical protein G9A89_000444 [Geosiphon pyriformis]
MVNLVPSHNLVSMGWVGVCWVVGGTTARGRGRRHPPLPPVHTQGKTGGQEAPPSPIPLYSGHLGYTGAHVSYSDPSALGRPNSLPPRNLINPQCPKSDEWI